MNFQIKIVVYEPCGKLKKYFLGFVGGFWIELIGFEDIFCQHLIARLKFDGFFSEASITFLTPKKSKVFEETLFYWVIIQKFL